MGIPLSNLLSNYAGLSKYCRRRLSTYNNSWIYIISFKPWNLKCGNLKVIYVSLWSERAFFTSGCHCDIITPAWRRTPRNRSHWLYVSGIGLCRSVSVTLLHLSFALSVRHISIDTILVERQFASSWRQACVKLVTVPRAKLLRLCYSYRQALNAYLFQRS